MGCCPATIKGVDVRVGSLSHTLAALGFLTSVLGASCGSTPLEPEKAPVGNAPAAPAITKITPTSGPVGTEVTVTGTGFAPRGNTVKFGSGYVKGLDSPDGTSLRFAIPDGLDLCSPDPGGPCLGAYPAVRPGDYAVAVIVNKEMGNAVTFTVTSP